MEVFRPLLDKLQLESDKESDGVCLVLKVNSYLITTLLFSMVLVGEDEVNDAVRKKLAIDFDSLSIFTSGKSTVLSEACKTLNH